MKTAAASIMLHNPHTFSCFCLSGNFAVHGLPKSIEPDSIVSSCRLKKMEQERLKEAAGDNLDKEEKKKKKK